MSGEASRQRQRRLVQMLVILSIATFAGPMGFGLILRGGPSPAWPPDRAVEWAYLLGNAGLIVVLMGAIVVIGVRGTRASTPGPAAEERG